MLADWSFRKHRGHQPGDDDLPHRYLRFAPHFHGSYGYSKVVSSYLLTLCDDGAGFARRPISDGFAAIVIIAEGHKAESGICLTSSSRRSSRTQKSVRF